MKSNKCSHPCSPSAVLKSAKIIHHFLSSQHESNPICIALISPQVLLDQVLVLFFLFQLFGKLLLVSATQVHKMNHQRSLLIFLSICQQTDQLSAPAFRCFSCFLFLKGTDVGSTSVDAQRACTNSGDEGKGPLKRWMFIGRRLKLRLAKSDKLPVTMNFGSTDS